MKKLFLLVLLFFSFLFYKLESFDSKKLSLNFSDEELDIFIEKMSLQDKVGQLFISVIYGEDLNEKAKKFIDKTHVGNFVFFSWSNGLKSFSQIKALSTNLKGYLVEKTDIIPIIAVDQEGGKVSRLKANFSNLSDGFTSFPSSREVAKRQPSFAYEMGKTIGLEMKGAGLNLNFAPVVDICSDDDYFLFPRTYDQDPKRVVLYAKEMIKGLHDGGVLSTLKHFPGLGNARVNPHFALAFLDKPLSEACKSDIMPFMLLKDDTDCIMTSHLIFKPLDQNNCATLSHAVLTDFLRNELKFNGVIISDSLAMRGVTTHQSNFNEAVDDLSHVAVKAFLAGCDCIIVSKLEWADFKPTDDQDYEMIERVLSHFQSRVENEEISLKRIDESVKRILRLKLKILKIQS